MTNLFVIIFSFLFLSGCATYQSRVSPARQELISGRCPSALKILEDLSNKDDGDQLVYLMDYATALQICADYKKSNSVFLKADKLSEQVDYQSVSRVAGATLLNEEMIQYKGDTFEKLFINAVAALNYLQLGETDEALVEVRRINEKYKKFSSDEKKKFELNSFSQYLSGLVWEMDQKYDDACISYKAAYKLDPSFRGVAIDMLRGCWLARRTQEFEIMVKEVDPSPDELALIKQKNKNETILIFMQGWGPQKAPRPEAHTFPYLKPVSSITKFLQAEIIEGAGDSKKSQSKQISELVYNVEKAAIDTLNDDYASLVARRVGARVTKEVLADQIRQKDKTLGNIAWLVMVAAERADLRQWSLLPATIQVIRVHSPSREKRIKLTGLDASHNVSEVFPDIDLSTLGKNKKLILIRSLK